MTQYAGATPVSKPSYKEVFDLETEDARTQYMRGLGARNLESPLPRSSHLRIKANGRVLPWDEMLAEQQELVECCDANGNTDPSAWLPTVDQSEHSAEEKELLMMQARAQVLSHAGAIQNQYNQGIAPNPKPDGGYPEGVISYEDIDKVQRDSLNNLIAMAEG